MTPFYIYIFLFVLFAGVPAVFSLIFAAAAGFVINEQYHFLSILPQRVFAGINQFPCLAVPLFMLAGEIMNAGAITKSLVRLSNVLMGHLRGGLAHVNILASILFAGLSGSAVADVSALGALLIPAMHKDGYPMRFSAAVTAASAIIGPIIPPSLIMVIYAHVMETSVAAMFAGGFIPGVLMGLALMVTTMIIAKKKDFPKKAHMASVNEIASALGSSFLPLLTPVIILGGILGGVFTPTEAAGVAAFYALILALFVKRTLKWRQLPKIFKASAINAASVLFVVGASVAFGWIATLSQIPQRLGQFISDMNAPLWVVIFGVIVVMLIIGMFLDAAPAVMIMGPILAPVVIPLGVHPVHFAVLMCVLATVGLVTPPMGIVLFLSASITNTTVEALALELLPFLATHFVVIALVAYVPQFTLLIPGWMGLL